MSAFSRRLLLGALILILLNTSCNLPAITPTATGTVSPTVQPTSIIPPTSTLVSETPTVVIPVTGLDEVSLQCQFCVNQEPHAVLILSEDAQFYVSDPTSRINCITAQVVNERRVLLCRGAQQASFNLNVCAENSSCLQYPILLETCPLRAQPAPATPVILTPINTVVSPTAPASTATPAVTQPVVVTTAPPQPAETQPPVATVTALPPQPSLTVPPVVATTANAPQARGTTAPTTRLPRTGLHDPEGFIRWYFEAVWKERNYPDLWENYLTPSFKARPNAGGYEGYAAWWSSVERVDVNSVDVLENTGTYAWVRVNVTFYMLDGRIISNQEYDYDLFFDATRRTWMFDYRTS